MYIYDEINLLFLIGPGSAQMPMLLRLLELDAPVIARILAEMGPEARPAVPKLLEKIECGKWQRTVALTRIDPTAARSVIPRLLKKPSRFLADVTKGLKDGEAQEHYARDEDESFYNALELAKFDERVAVVLGQLFADKNHLQAVAKMGRLSKHAFPFLVRKLGENDSVDTVLSLLNDLGAEAKPAVPGLKKLLTDPDPFLQLKAAILLADLDSSIKESIPFLIDELQSPAPLMLHVEVSEDDRARAELWGIMLKRPDLPAQLGKLPDSITVRYRRFLIGKLGNVGMGNGAVIEALRPLLQNPALRQAAQDALTKISSHS